MEKIPPSIPSKRYFTIGEVGELCGVKPHVLRYWEQEFNQLRPMKRRGNRRYYQHHEVLMIRRIRDLLYDQGFTISGARNRLQELGEFSDALQTDLEPIGDEAQAATEAGRSGRETGPISTAASIDTSSPLWLEIRSELLQIRELLFIDD